MLTLSGCATLNPTIPIEIPIDLSKAGSVAEAEFWVSQDDRIQISLYFLFKNPNEDGKYLYEILGPNNTPGVKIPLKIRLEKQISSKQNELILEKTYISEGVTGTSSNFLRRSIDTISIKPGSYRLRLENLQSTLQLIKNKVEVRVYFVRAPIL
jgi:hypothetical protein